MGESFDRPVCGILEALVCSAGSVPLPGRSLAGFLGVRKASPFLLLEGSRYAHRVPVESPQARPAFQHPAARRNSGATLSNEEFALKVADLWRYESGLAIDRVPGEWKGWEIFIAAHARGEGVLLVTPHLGNWELGGTFLAQHGCQLEKAPGRIRRLVVVVQHWQKICRDHLATMHCERPIDRGKHPCQRGAHGLWQ
jgi:Bacterial lipid A biosynthesis acyltransferase